jgi:hypothetical protein
MEAFSEMQNLNWENIWEEDSQLIYNAKAEMRKYYARFNSMLEFGERISLSFKKSSSNIKNMVDNRMHFSQIYFPMHKPDAFWLSHGINQFDDDIGWLDWAIDEMPNKVLPWKVDVYAVKLVDDESIILKLDTQPKIISFTYKYKYGLVGVGRKRYPFEINWRKVQDDGYRGIDISPYQSDLHNMISWYNTWDCASQAVWDYRGIEYIRKLN